tara:strand:+ start:5406 stop:5522 length:117 start_codon:yes stop_codon:yes gene_type:complete
MNKEKQIDKKKEKPLKIDGSLNDVLKASVPKKKKETKK